MRQVILTGLLIWIIPFVVSMTMYPLRLTNRPLFQSLMSDVLVMSVIIASYLYFPKRKTMSLLQSLETGCMWLLISFVLDVGIFIVGPIHMSFFEYLSEIGSAYLMIPLIAAGFSFIFPSIRKEVK